MPVERKTNDGAWCWQTKQALRLIGTHFAESGKVASARSVYLAFTEYASNEQSPRFQAKIDSLAQLAGVSGRTVRDVLPEFELLALLRASNKTGFSGRLGHLWPSHW